MLDNACHDKMKARKREKSFPMEIHYSQGIKTFKKAALRGPDSIKLVDGLVQ